LLVLRCGCYDSACVWLMGGEMPDASVASIVRQSKPAASLPGGWPEASLPEHLALGKFDRSVSLGAWAYNEELLVESFLWRAIDLLNRTVHDWEIVFVDDGSTDRTPEILQSFAQREPRLRVIRHARNLNVGFAFRTAMASARNEIFFSQTVDWSYDLSNLRIFLELLRYFDVVQGIRPVPIRLLSYIPVVRSIYRIQRRSDTLYKAIISLANYYILRILFGARFHDFQNITFYPSKWMQEIEMVGRTSFANPEILLKSYYRGARFIEVPIRFIKRSQGDAKGTKLKTVVRSFVDTIRNWLSWGIRLRFGRKGVPLQRVYRVAEPFRLEPPVLRLILPLFDDFKSSTDNPD
jgi:glycosyltransferase involved in cell wall biosynthesis